MKAVYSYSLSCLLWAPSFQNSKVDERVEFCLSKKEFLVFSDLADAFACLLLVAAGGVGPQWKGSRGTGGALPPCSGTGL